MECDHEDHHWVISPFALVLKDALLSFLHPHVDVEVCLKCGIIRVPAAELVARFKREANADPA